MSRSATASAPANQRTDALPLDAAKIDHEPLFFPNGVVGLPPEIFTFDSLERIIEAAGSGPAPNVMCRCSVQVPQDAKAKPVADKNFRGALEQRLRNENIHIMVTNADRFDPRIKALLGEFLDRVGPFFRSSGIGLFDPSCALFLSSPGSLARFHNDMEYGFLHHARGTKTIHIYPYDDARLNPSDVDDSKKPMRSLEATKAYMDYFASRAWKFTMDPGQAVYIPPLLPHWVEAGNEIAVSLTFVLFGRDGMRRRKVDHVNRLLELRGRRPTPYSRKPLVDHLKCATYAVLSGLGRVKPNH